MLRHIVMFNLKDGVARDDPRVDKAVRMIAALPDQIDSVVEAELGWDTSRKPHSLDYATLWKFHDAEGLARYSAHPAHLAVLEATRDIFDAKIADYLLTE
ncbi:Dabb family protein [Paracoccus seriniphilus]|uniref:Stress responsive A/B Barrel Domain n=1 Tax=Paracoccus seriniphilus TaxID=184748 RepID=A0A239PVL7_9RHOB|nr:Dabb family protein [Paracoccus seriniphilus]WCR16526.1 Dabb family protein [Paracoccus seriniphilus]SNT73737.1 Stress responsive A/B Barrel Domain [Paracoccus seriniphilus]